MREFLYSQLIGLPIFGEEEHRVIGRVTDLITDPETGKGLGFGVTQNRILVPMDILALESAVVIPDASHLVSPDEVLRIHEVLKGRIIIYGNRVVSESGEVCGVVTDFSVDSHLSLKSITVSKQWFVFRTGSRIIPAKAIVEITRTKIVVKDAHILAARKETTAASQMMPAQ